MLVGQGMSRPDAIRQVSITEQTYYRWRKQYGGMGVDQLKELKETNAFLRGLVAYVGYKQAYIEYERDERKDGNSKYNKYFGSLKIAFNGIGSDSHETFILTRKLPEDPFNFCKINRK